jgi:hypothetical protein
VLGEDWLGDRGFRKAEGSRELAPLVSDWPVEFQHEDVAVRMFSRTFLAMPERIQKPVEPAPWGPKKGDGDGPRSPDISRPDTKDLLKKMRKVDPNQSKRYRQRTGQ